MKLVKFEDGTYGIRASFWDRSIFGWNFHDLYDPASLLNLRNPYFGRCKGDREQVEKVMKSFSDKHTVVEK